MAACGSLDCVIEKPLPPWKQMKSIKAIEDSSFAEIFSELHLKENHLETSSSSSPFPQSSPTSFSSFSSTLTTELHPIEIPNRDKNKSSDVHQGDKNFESSNYPDFHAGSFSSMSSENLSTCTEDFAVESSIHMEDLPRHDFCKTDNWKERKGFQRKIRENCGIKNGSGGGFPPPISCIGRSGKPWVYFKSYKENGRFVLKEIRIPTQEFMQASRENGRLKLTFIHSESDDEFFADDEEEEEEDDE